MVAAVATQTTLNLLQNAKALVLTCAHSQSKWVPVMERSHVGSTTMKLKHVSSSSTAVARVMETDLKRLLTARVVVARMDYVMFVHFPQMSGPVMLRFPFGFSTVQAVSARSSPGVAASATETSSEPLQSVEIVAARVTRVMFVPFPKTSDRVTLQFLVSFSTRRAGSVSLSAMVVAQATETTFNRLMNARVNAAPLLYVALERLLLKTL